MEPFVIMTNQHQEPLSAMLDDELTNNELTQALDSIKDDQQSVQTFGRYALIGDVLRKEQELVSDDSFANSIQAAIADIELPMVDQLETDNVASIAKHPKWYQRASQKVVQLGEHKLLKGSAQFAIAASVALVAVVGVSNMNPGQDKVTSPVLNPVPLVQGLSPVSLSSDSFKEKPTANQVTQSRINALMADHNQQLRATDDKEELEKEDKKIEQ